MPGLIRSREDTLTACKQKVYRDDDRVQRQAGPRTLDDVHCAVGAGRGTRLTKASQFLLATCGHGLVLEA